MRKIKTVAKQCTHYWIIDCRDVGICKYCGEGKDFGKLQREVQPNIEAKLKIKGVVRNPYGRKGKGESQ